MPGRSPIATSALAVIAFILTADDARSRLDPGEARAFCARLHDVARYVNDRTTFDALDTIAHPDGDAGRPVMFELPQVQLSHFRCLINPDARHDSNRIVCAGGTGHDSDLLACAQYGRGLYVAPDRSLFLDGRVMISQERRARPHKPAQTVLTLRLAQGPAGPGLATYDEFGDRLSRTGVIP